jgi:uncharacterized protein
MARSGYADLPLHYGRVPQWLAERMTFLGGAIIESILQDYGRAEVLKRLSDPLWFQSFGCVLGMDWHSSGITTSVMGALKRAINPRSNELGIFICGGRGRHSRNTPSELLKVADRTGLNGLELVRSSKLAAKVDNTAVQDGFQLYLHNFILTIEGDWSIVQQGLNDATGMARRYHWHSASLKSYLDEPHVGVTGINQGLILNLTDRNAEATKQGILKIAKEDVGKILPEVRKILMPRHHEVTESDVNLKRLGAVMIVAQECSMQNFESLLLIEGLGPRTLQSLTLVSEVIHGTPSRFSDPARFAFAHGGKDGHPFPVPLRVYDETINTLTKAVEHARIGNSDRKEAIKRLSALALKVEESFKPKEFFQDVVERERNNSYRYGGKTVFGDAKPPKASKPEQLKLF